MPGIPIDIGFAGEPPMRVDCGNEEFDCLGGVVGTLDRNKLLII